jgi:hypothetical protein
LENRLAIEPFAKACGAAPHETPFDCQVRTSANLRMLDLTGYVFCEMQYREFDFVLKPTSTECSKNSCALGIQLTKPAAPHADLK